MIVNAGIKKIFYQNAYADPMSQELLAEAGVEVVHFEPENQGGAP
jgi:deoxycytidylate deaminase